MKTFNEIKTWIERRIERRKETLENFVIDCNHTDEVIHNRNIVRVFKSNFESIYKAQYEMTQYMIILERIKSYEEEKQSENVLLCMVIGELDCWKTSMKRDLLEGQLMPSTTNASYNLCGLWETELHRKMIRDIENLLK